MNAVAIGPFVFDDMRFAAFIGIGTFFLLAEILDRLLARRGRETRLTQAAGQLFVIWAVASRLGHVLGNWSAYAQAPLDILKFWQGGFALSWGFVAAILAGLVLTQRHKPLTRPLVATGLAAVAAGGITAMVLFDPTGPQLPDAPLVDLAGDEVRLTEGDGPMVLNLWATWCPPCRREMPMMMELAASPGAPRFVFANQGEGDARIRDFLQKLDLPDRDIALDPGSALMQGLGTLGLPLTLFYSADGRMVAAHTGEISRAELARRMAEITAAPAE